MKGWICLHRCITKHWIWQDANRFKWWVDLLLKANHEDRKILFDGTLKDCKRGDILTSLSKLAEEWNVSRDVVRHFLNMLESDTMITRKTTQKYTQITICNYVSYQDVPTTDPQQTHNTPTTDPQHTHTNNNYNNYNNNNIYKEKESCKKNLATAQTKVKVFIKPSLEEVRSYCQSRGNDVDAERWYNYYSANGWKVGRNAMKDWKAAVRTWENSKDNGNKTTTVPENNSQWRDANRQGWDFSQTDL